MVRLISRRRLLAAAAAATVSAGAVGGTVLAAHSGSAGTTAAVGAATSTPSPDADHGRHADRGRHGHHGHAHLGKLTAIGATSITIVDARGTSHTYTLAPRVRIVGSDGRPEAAASLTPGELVVVVTGHAGRDRDAGATPQAGAPTVPDSDSIAEVIRDTGFAVR